MTSDPESRLFDFAGSKRNPETEDEHMVTELQAALGLEHVPSRLRRPPVTQPRPDWRHYFPVTAAVILVIALLGASFSTLVPGDDNGGQFASVPPVVLGLVGADSDIISQIPNNGQGCTFDRPPLILQANAFPVDELTVIYTDSGELKLHCPGMSDGPILAGDVITVEPTGIPETMVIGTRAPDRPDYEPTNLSLINLRTGTIVDLANTRTDQQFTQSQSSPWFISSMSVESDDLLVTDLRTMESHVLETPEWIEGTGSMSGQITSSEDGSVAAVLRITPPGYSSDRGQLIGETEGTPQLRIIRDEFETAQWIDIANIDDAVTTATMSPDGRFIALGLDRNTSDDYLGGVNQYIVIDVSNGEEVGRTESDTLLRVSSAQWSLDSTSFLYTIGDKLGVIDPAAEEPNRIVLQEDGAVDYLMLTPDPNVVLVDITSVQSETVLSLYRVHIDTGESEHIGRSVSRTLYDGPVMRTPIIRFFDGSDITLVDAATGEQLDSWTTQQSVATPQSSEPISYTSSLNDTPFSVEQLDGRLGLWIWNRNLEPKHLEVPKFPNDVSRFQLKLVDRNRYVIIQEFPDPINFEKPLITYILDTEAEEPIWIPVE